MQTKILLLSVFSFVFVVSQAQVRNRRPVHPARSSSVNELTEERLHQRQLTTHYLPVNEVDSLFDTGSGWSYLEDVAHTYYSSNCRDSVDTYSINGVNDRRVTYGYDAFGYLDYQLDEIWNGSNWENSSLFVETAQPIGCFFDYYYGLNWNGVSWDTSYGMRTTVANFNGYNNPVLFERQHYINNTWKNYYRYTFTYDASQQLTGWERDTWDSTLSQYTPDWVRTNYTFYHYNGICDYAESSEESMDWNGSSWENGSKYYYSMYDPDTVLTLLWNGSSWDTTYLDIFGPDSYGTDIGSMDYIYNSTTHAWDISYLDYYVMTYGVNNELLHKIEMEDWSTPSPDSIVPYISFWYSDFFPCTDITSVHQGQQDNAFHVYPNPAHDVVTVSAGDDLEQGTLTVYNVLGKTILNKPVTGKAVTVLLSGWMPGIYFLKLTDGKNVFSEKISVQ